MKVSMIIRSCLGLLFVGSLCAMEPKTAVEKFAVLDKAMEKFINPNVAKELKKIQDLRRPDDFTGMISPSIRSTSLQGCKGASLMKVNLILEGISSYHPDGNGTVQIELFPSVQLKLIRGIGAWDYTCLKPEKTVLLCNKRPITTNEEQQSISSFLSRYKNLSIFTLMSLESFLREKR